MVYSASWSDPGAGASIGSTLSDAAKVRGKGEKEGGERGKEEMVPPFLTNAMFLPTLEKQGRNCSTAKLHGYPCFFCWIVFHFPKKKSFRQRLHCLHALSTLTPTLFPLQAPVEVANTQIRALFPKFQNFSQQSPPPPHSSHNFTCGQAWDNFLKIQHQK